LDGKPFRFSSFDISFMTAFQQKILGATCQIPWGQVRTYGWVAKKAGSPRGFRAAGQALNRNPVPLFIPCHRVIASGGLLGGYGGGEEWKISLLENEGIGVNQGVVNLVTA
jgi:O-6-methylguanine DNA methyltransferase